MVSSADKFYKQFGPRSGPTKRRAWSGSKLFDTLANGFKINCLSRKIFLKKLVLKNNQQTTKKYANLPSMQTRKMQS